MKLSGTVLVTGAGRGIGLELCRQFSQRDYRVIACPRRADSPELDELAQAEHVLAVPMDVGDPRSIEQATESIGRHVDAIDILVNNAGIYPSKGGGLEQMDESDLMRAFEVNTIGPLRVVRALLPLLRKGRERKLIQMTSLMGSIDDNSSGGSYAYRLSKAALNMANKNLAHELGREGFISMVIHPGWVQTRMGGGAAPMSLQSAVADIVNTVVNATSNDNGEFRGPGGRTLSY